jgi:hypothetical protein
MSFECPHLFDGICQRRNADCKPGAKYCVLAGRFEFPAIEEENKVIKDTGRPETPKKKDQD